MIDETLRQEFESDWLSGRTVAIEDYLPDRTDEKYISTLEELVCIDLEFAWKDPNRRNKPLVENYLEQFSELDSKEILSRLVKQEIRVRSAHDAALSSQEYSERFPGLTDVFQTTFAGTDVGDFDHQPSGDLRFKEFVSGETAGRYFLLD